MSNSRIEWLIFLDGKSNISFIPMKRISFYMRLNFHEIHGFQSFLTVVQYKSMIIVKSIIVQLKQKSLFLRKQTKMYLNLTVSRKFPEFLKILLHMLYTSFTEIKSIQIHFAVEVMTFSNSSCKKSLLIVLSHAILHQLSCFKKYKTIKNRVSNIA